MKQKKSCSSWWWGAAISVIINYNTYKRELEAIRADIIEHQGNEKVIDYGIADTTGERASKLVDNKRVKFLTDAVEAVEYAMTVTRNYSVDVDQYYRRIKLIDEMYWRLGNKKLPKYYLARAAQAVAISESLAYLWRKEFLLLVAKKMGWEE